MKDNQTPTITKIGLKQLSEDDLETISGLAYDLVIDTLGKRVRARDIDSYDIVIEIDNKDNLLQIDIDIILEHPSKNELEDNAIIQSTLEDAFEELDRVLQEKYSS
ncbi:MAG: DUF3194 domain-containing protein, partial [Candidatus Heimdallarchaeota archaeon]